MAFPAENAHCLVLVLGGVITGSMLGCGSPAYSIPSGSNRDNRAPNTGGTSSTARSHATTPYGTNLNGTNLNGTNPNGTEPKGTNLNGTDLNGTGGHTTSTLSTSTDSASYATAGTTQRESSAAGGNPQLTSRTTATESIPDAGARLDCDALCALPH